MFLQEAMAKQVPDTPATGRGHLLRIYVFAHLAAISYWAVGVLWDYGRIEPPEFLSFLFTESLIQVPLALAWLIFPVLILITVAKDHTLSNTGRFAYIALGVFLALFQHWVMLPLVQ